MILSMNIKRNQLVIDLISTLLQFIIVYMLIAIALRTFFTDAALKALLLLPAPFLSYAIRRTMKHIWSFLLLHAALFALYVFTARHPLLMAAYGIYLMAIIIYAFYQRHRSADQGISSPYMALFLLFFYLCSYFLHMPDMQKLCFLLAIIYILLNVINIYLSNLSRFARNHADLQNVPFQQIRSSNHVLIMFLSGLFLLTMLVFSYVPLGAVISYVGKILLRVLRMLLSLIHLSEPDVPEEAAPQEAAPATYDIPPAEPSRLMQLISEIFQWIATILMIAAVLALILYGIYRLYRYFYLKSEVAMKDEVVFISPISRKERTARKNGHSRLWSFGRSNNDTIRKTFAKAVSANRKGNAQLSKNMTPSQLSEYALGSAGFTQPPAEFDDKKQQLTAHYEKARYSDRQCTREEVRKVKELLK